MRRNLELHITEGRRHALNLWSYSTSVYPEPWGEGPLIELVTSELMSFASHARRVVQLLENDFEEIDCVTGAYKFSVFPDAPIEQNFKHALNSLVHYNSFSFHWAKLDGRKVFTKYSNLVPAFVEVTTEKYPNARCISIAGMGRAFLSDVILEAKTKVPDLKF